MRPVTELQRAAKSLEVISPYSSSGDQPMAVTELTECLRAGEEDIVLLGATGAGKSMATAWFIEQIQRSTPILEPNEALAVQMVAEFRELLPNNAAEHFTSYYDHYQPEVYVPQTDTFIEKDSSINDGAEYLCRNAINSLLTRRDIVAVSSASYIYGLDTPQEYADWMTPLEVGQQIGRNNLLRCFVSMQYIRNDIDFIRGTFRMRDDTVEITPMYEKPVTRAEFSGDEIEALVTLYPATGDVIGTVERVFVFPTSHYVAGPERMQKATGGIEAEFAECLARFKYNGRLPGARRLHVRIAYDLEMLQQIGMCPRVENYSLHIDGCETGTPPNVLLDCLPEGFPLIIDESHVTIPWIDAMHEGDVFRKHTLIEHGLHLPPALDNRPLTLAEFKDRIGQTVYLSATPGDYKTQRSDDVVEQVIRPMELVDPRAVVKSTQGQIDDLLEEVRTRVRRQERISVTTLIKCIAEDLTTYLAGRGVCIEYLHSDVDTLRCVKLLHELRLGRLGVLVGINLLCKGLDLLGVSLVSVLDADKEGFLRSTRSLVQTIGYAVRNVSDEAHAYADIITPTVAKTIEGTERRRTKQLAYNAKHSTNPQPLREKIADVTGMLAREDVDIADLLAGGYQGYENSSARARRKHAAETMVRERLAGAAQGDLAELISELTQQIHAAAGDLHFGSAARLRDEIQDLKKELRAMWVAD